MNNRRLFTWTPKQLDKLNKVINVLSEFEKYKPLTLRQVYYQLVGKGYIENKVSEYTMLSGLLKHSRIDEYISWDDIEDRVRTFHNLTGWNNRNVFIQKETEQYLSGYYRNLMQTQDKYIEIWIEKDALSSIFTEVAGRYTIPVVVCRGFSSASFLNDFKNRVEFHKDKQTLMLYFGDFDPSGMEMLPAMITTLEQEFKVNDIKFKRIALSKEDIFEYKLPYNAKALKKTDTRAKKYVEQYGEIAVELDALRPDILEEKIKTAIENELNVGAFNAEVEKHNADLVELDKLKMKVVNVINE
jgi:hypothetical protein